MPTSLLSSLPSHQKIHTHTNLIFSPFDVYFNRSHQFIILVWQSVFSWLAISKKADLCRHNSKWSDLFYSVTGCTACTSPWSLSGVAEGTFSFDSASFSDSASYFGTLLGFDSVSYMHRNRKNSLVFLFSSPYSTEWHMIGFSFSRFLSEVFWPSWSYSIPWKTREEY